jgi:DNA repair exonuclease SbcCD nuclease subunit
MPRLAFIYRTDVHVSDKSPASWKGDYPAEIWANLRQIGEFAKKYGATAVLDGGDYFHVKAASRNSHSLVFQSAEVQKGYPCDTYCVEGNHDVQYNNLETIEKQPLGVLYAAGVFQHLREQVFEDGDLRVRVVGVPYSPTRTLNELRLLRKKPGDTFLIAVVHALASENPPPAVEDFFGEPVFRYSDLVFPNGPDLYCFGHWHRDQGIVTLDGRTFMNQGAVSRGALIKENLERKPKVGLIEITPDGISTKALLLDVLPAAEVFDVERKERQDEQTRHIDQFVQKIQTDLLIDPEASIESTLSSMTFAGEIRELALHYLENARLKKVG